MASKGEKGEAGTNGIGVTSAKYTGKECKEGGLELKSASGTTYVCNGEKGKEGTQTLPKGKTLVGAFAASGYGEEGFPNSKTGHAETAVSFALPLSEGTTVHYVKEGESTPPGCTGNSGEPGAEEGNLCVFVTGEDNAFVPGGLAAEPIQFGTRGDIGFAVKVFSAAQGTISVEGTWAVTAG